MSQSRRILGGSSESAANIIPSSEATLIDWTAGDWRRNTDAATFAATGLLGWGCQITGTAGTWLAIYGALSPVSSIAQGPGIRLSGTNPITIINRLFEGDSNGGAGQTIGGGVNAGEPIVIRGSFHGSNGPVVIDATRLQVPVGSAAVPSIGFAGDTDTGIYRPSAGVLGIAADTNLVALFSGTSTVRDVTIGDNGTTTTARVSLITDTHSAQMYVDETSGRLKFGVNNVDGIDFGDAQDLASMDTTKGLRSTFGLYVAVQSQTNFAVGRQALVLDLAVAVPDDALAVLDYFQIRGSAVTFAGTTNVTTATGLNWVTISPPTFSGTKTIANAATVAIGGAPIVGAMTITNPYAFWIQGGAIRTDSFGSSGLIKNNFGSAWTLAVAGTDYIRTITAGTNVTNGGTAADWIINVTGGASGSVTSVGAGTGITITGTPTVNPTVHANISTGVSGGQSIYGGVNAGEILIVYGSLHPSNGRVLFVGLTASSLGSIQVDNGFIHVVNGGINLGNTGFDGARQAFKASFPSTFASSSGTGWDYFTVNPSTLTITGTSGIGTHLSAATFWGNAINTGAPITSASTVYIVGQPFIASGGGSIGIPSALRVTGGNTWLGASVSVGPAAPAGTEIFTVTGDSFRDIIRLQPSGGGYTNIDTSIVQLMLVVPQTTLMGAVASPFGSLFFSTYFGQPVLQASGIGSAQVNRAATVHIAGPPILSGSWSTLNTLLSLDVASGTVFVQDSLLVGGAPGTGFSALIARGGSTPRLGFFGGDQTLRTVTGSRGGNAALDSLLLALGQYGLINNSTTP